MPKKCAKCPVFAQSERLQVTPLPSHLHVLLGEIHVRDVEATQRPRQVVGLGAGVLDGECDITNRPGRRSSSWLFPQHLVRRFAFVCAVRTVVVVEALPHCQLLLEIDVVFVSE